MKKLFLLIILIGLFNLAYGAKIQNYTIYNVDNYVERLTNELNIPDSVTIQIVQSEHLILGKYKAATSKATPQVYTILIYKLLSFDETEFIIAHEIVHVKQLQSGKLKILGDNMFMYDDKRFKNKASNHYTDKQEKEARHIGYILYNKFKSNYLKP